MTPARPEFGRAALAGIALRLALGLPLLIRLAQASGWHYADQFLPWYRAILELLMPDHDEASLGLTWQKCEWRIAGEFVTEHVMLVHGRLLPAGAGVSAATLMAHALKHPLILAAAALTWPGLGWRGRGLRLLLSLPFQPFQPFQPFLVLLETLDVPLVLASAVNDMLSWMASPEADDASKTVDWTGVLDGGGRMALGIAAAFAAAGVHGWLDRYRNKTVTP